MDFETEVEDDQDPIQQHIEIHRRRIGTIVDRLLEKLTLAICLETLLQDHDPVLSEHLTVKQLIFLHEYNTKQKSISGGTSLRNAYSKSTTDTSNSSISRKILRQEEYYKDMNLSNIVGTMHHSEELMKIVKEIFPTMTGATVNFMSQMHELKNYIMELLYTSATQQRINEKAIGNAWLNNERYKNKIIEMQVTHSAKRNELLSKVHEKNMVINNYKEQMELEREKCLINLVSIINSSEAQMARTTYKSEENREYLSDEAKQVMQQYQTLLETHLAHEKQMRVKRFKIETVLAGWIAKYDEGIGELTAIMEVQQDGFDAEKQAFDDLTARCETQLEEFNFLMEEKAENERLELEYEVYIFTTNYCAKKIQRWFRRYLALMAKRRKRAKAARKNK